MSLGILTFHFAHNYGAVLQAYSLYSYLSSLGQEVEIIDYRPKSMVDEYSLSPFKAASKRDAVRRALDYSRVKGQHALFESFINNDLKLSSVAKTSKDVEALCQEFDRIIVGSDQVWNPDLTGNDGVYFLDFPLREHVAAYSYAASFGKKSLEGIPSNFIKCLEKFNAVTLREMTCAEELFQLTGLKAEQVVDPVFLHDSEFWSPLSMPVDVQGPYCLYYGLQENPGLMEFASKESGGLPIYSVHPTCVRQPVGSNLNNIGPKEFLSLVAGAKCVFTNSFHGLAFSSIFGKDTYTAFHSTLGSRSATLLRLFDIDPGNESGVVHADFSVADRTKLNEMIGNSKGFLSRCIGGE